MNITLKPIGSVVAALLLVSWTASTAFGAEFQITFCGDWAFRPSEVDIKVGDTVTWTNSSPDPLQAGSEEGLWEAIWLQPGDFFSHTFTAAGTFGFRDFDKNLSCAVVVSSAAVVAPPTPALAAPTWTADGRFQFTVTNLGDGKRFVIQSCTNLLPAGAMDWVGVTNTASGTSYTYTEDAAAAGGARFYRVLALASQ